MATKKTPETTVRVETVGVNEIADAVADRVAKQVSRVDDKVNKHYRSARSESGRHLQRIKRLEARISELDDDVETLFKMASGQQTGVTVTRHRASRGC